MLDATSQLAAARPSCFGELFVKTEKDCQGCLLALACKKEQRNVPSCFGSFDGNVNECVGTTRSLACAIGARCSNARNGHIQITRKL